MRFNQDRAAAVKEQQMKEVAGRSKHMLTYDTVIHQSINRLAIAALEPPIFPLYELPMKYTGSYISLPFI